MSGEFGPGTLTVQAIQAYGCLGHCRVRYPRRSQNEGVWSDFLMGLCWVVALTYGARGRKWSLQNVLSPRKLPIYFEE